MRGDRARAGRLIGDVLARIVLLGVFWWALTEGRPGSPISSSLAVLAAVAVSIALVPPRARRWRPRGVLGFAGFFMRQSIRGGIDVARRALDPRLPIRPGFIEHRVRLPGGPARAWFVLSISLLPGTLSTRLRGDALRIHVLDRRQPARVWIEQLEERVAALFGVEI